MNFIEPFIRRAARMIGWEITGAIESVVWSLAIGLFLMCCCILSCGAIAFQMVFHR
jgi:hypothetical protein